MILPTYNQFMLPLIKLTAEDGQVHPIASLRERLAQQFDITSEQRAIRLPSEQQSVFDDCIGWANTYRRKAGLLSRPKRGYVQITQRERNVLTENPTAIETLYLQRFDAFREFRERSATEDTLATTSNATPASTTTSEETIAKRLAFSMLNCGMNYSIKLNNSLLSTLKDWS